MSKPWRGKKEFTAKLKAAIAQWRAEGGQLLFTGGAAAK